MNCVLPVPGFLEALRAVCDQHGSVLIFDEVMTGFRVALGGAQALYGIKPDLTTLGKIVGGGMPVGAFGGRRDIMEQIAPLGPVYQAGTLSGNPVAMAAGLATLDRHQRSPASTSDSRERTDATDRRPDSRRHAPPSVPFTHQSRLRHVRPVLHRQDAGALLPRSHGLRRRALQALLPRACSHEGIYLAPSAFEAGFVSAAHSTADIDATIAAARRAFAALGQNR